MANIKEKDIWEEHIYQIETSDPVLGGENGIANRQAKQLAARTQFLKKEVEKSAVKHSPAFTGEPTAPTPEQSTNNQQIATTEFVKTAIAALVGSAPAELDTLEELAALLAENGDLRRALLQKIGEKVSKTGDTMTGPLFINALHPHVGGRRNGTNKWFVGLANETNDDAYFHSYTHDTYLALKGNRAEFNKPLFRGSHQFWDDGNLPILSDDVTNLCLNPSGIGTDNLATRFEWSGRIENLDGVNTRCLFNRDNFYQRHIPVKVGEELYVSAWVKHKAGNKGCAIGAYFRVNGSNEVWIAAKNISATEAGQWIKIEGYVTAPTGAITARLWLQIQQGNTETVGQYYVRDVVFRRANNSAATFSGSLTENGWQKLPSGLILQWGRLSARYETVADYAFNIAFPNQCFLVTATHSIETGKASQLGMLRRNAGVSYAFGPSDLSMEVNVYPLNNTHMRLWTDNDSGVEHKAISWIAIGY